MKKCVMYLRRSTDKQDQSLGDQEEANRQYAQREGYEIVGTFVDDAISGAATASRKEFLGMIEAAQAPGREWHWILVYDVTRFGRQQSDEAGHYRYLLQQAGVEVKYVAEGFRGDSTDDLLLGVKQHMAHQMVLDVSKLTIRGQVSLAQKGRWCGGKAPYGYDLLHLTAQGDAEQVVRFLKTGEREVRCPETGEVRKVVPAGKRMRSTGDGHTQLIAGDPERVAVLRRIFAMYVGEGVGLSGIAGRLNAEGIPSPGTPRKDQTRPSAWSLSTVRGIIRNPAYRGANVWNRRSFSKYNRVKDGRAEAKARVGVKPCEFNEEKDWVIEEGQHEALVSPELWEAAQSLLESRKGQMTPELMRAAKKSSRYVLSGLVTCGKCGARWQGRKTRKGRKKPGAEQPVTYSYCCGGYVRSGNAVCVGRGVGQELLEAEVLSLAQEYFQEFASRGGEAALAQIVVEQGTVSTTELDALRHAIYADREQMDKLIACLTPDLAPALAPKIKELQIRVKDGEMKLANLESFSISQREAELWVAELMQNARALGDLMKSGTVAERRSILKGITQEIVFDPETRTGEVCFFAVPLELVGGNVGDTKQKRTPSGDDVLSCAIKRVAGARFEPATWGVRGV